MAEGNMSFKIEINGHTSNPHNQQIKEIAEEAYAKVKALFKEGEFPPTLTGYSGDQTGSIALVTPQPDAPKEYGIGPTEADKAATETNKESKESQDDTSS